jgi:hypothetical protein
MSKITIAGSADADVLIFVRRRSDASELVCGRGLWRRTTDAWHGGPAATDTIGRRGLDRPEFGTGRAMSEQTTGTPDEPGTVLTILLYASDRSVRENVRFALGRRVAADLPEVRVLEVATQPAVITAMDRGGIDLAILDGEAVPGGMGLGRQLKDEIHDCPPILLIAGRADDAWLATWSRADGVVGHPVDPVRLPAAAAVLLRAGRAARATQG